MLAVQTRFIRTFFARGRGAQNLNSIQKILKMIEMNSVQFTKPILISFFL